MKLASEIKNLNVFSLEDKQIVGMVKDLIIDPSNGNLIAFLISGKNVDKKRKIISFVDVKHFDSEVLIVDSKEALGSKEELPKAYEIVKSKIKINGSKVVTEAGVRVGIVTDFALDTNVDKLSRIYVSKNKISSILGTSLIYSYDQIVEIKKKKIIVLDDKNRVKERSAAQSTA